MNIRKVASDDWERFKAIRLAGLASDPQAFGGSFAEEVGREEPEWRKRLERSDRFFFAVEEGGVFMAVAGAKQTSDALWMLVGVHTLPEARGKGFAQALTIRVLDEMKAKGARKAELMVNVDQRDAVHIYGKAGFKVVKLVKDEKMGDGLIHDEYLMEKDLA